MTKFFTSRKGWVVRGSIFAEKFSAPCSLKILAKSRGFALIELLLVLSIIIIVTVLSFVSLSTFRGQSDLDGTTERVLDALRVARSRTLASENASSYGVRLETATYTIFTGHAYTAGAADNEPETVPQNVEIFDVLLSTTTQSVVFERLTGETSTTGTISLRTTDAAHVRTIRIESSGNAYVTATSVAELDTRITDTRHLHFDLGWSIQNATTLRLLFSDFPEPNVVNDIDMASYFNAGKTRFLWEGDTVAFGSNQHIKVHTHSLDSINTLLSIHRDRRYNDKKLVVYIVDGVEKQIVEYTASGGATVNITYGGTMTQQ